MAWRGLALAVASIALVRAHAAPADVEDRRLSMCQPNQSCTGNFPALRGVCVIDGSLYACWDVCDLSHQPEDYVVSADSDLNRAMKMMVTQVREGKNPSTNCGIPITVERCPVGSRCGGKPYFENIPDNRGLCVLEQGNSSCRDMCNYDFEPEAYKAGTRAGAAALVRDVRARRDWKASCPGPSWWWWLILILAICCCCGCLAVAVAAYLTGRIPGNRKTRSPARMDPVLDVPGPEPMKDRGVVLPGQDQPLLQHANNVFDALDTNNDGILTRDEIERGKAMGIIASQDPPLPQPPPQQPPPQSMQPQQNLFNIQPLVVPESHTQAVYPQPSTMMFTPSPMNQPPVAYPQRSTMVLGPSPMSQPPVQMQPQYRQAPQPYAMTTMNPMATQPPSAWQTQLPGSRPTSVQLPVQPSYQTQTQLR